MSDPYQEVRSIPLRDVLSMLGIPLNQFKKRAGKKEWYGPCIFHTAKKNKTSFSFTDEKFNCFSCGEHGSGSIDLVMKLKKIGFQEAVKFLGGTRQEHAAEVVSPAKKDTVRNNECEKVFENKPYNGVYEKHYVPSEWLKNRGLTEETLKLFGVGQYFNPSRKSLYSNKILFPVRRFKDGVKTAYLARTIEENSADPKYIFPKGFHKQLEVFGAWQIKQLAQEAGASNASGERASGLTLPLQVGYVVESPLCVMRYWQMGLYAVSPFGAFLSSEQVEIIRHLFRGILFLPDRDKSQKVADTIQLAARHLWIKSPELPAGIDDPEKLNLEQIHALLKS